MSCHVKHVAGSGEWGPENGKASSLVYGLGMCICMYVCSGLWLAREEGKEGEGKGNICLHKFPA